MGNTRDPTFFHWYPGKPTTNIFRKSITTVRLDHAPFKFAHLQVNSCSNKQPLAKGKTSTAPSTTVLTIETIHTACMITIKAAGTKLVGPACLEDLRK